MLILNQIIYLQWAGLSLNNVYLDLIIVFKNTFVTFIEGEIAVKKVTPEKAALEMKKLEIDGENYLSSKEYLCVTQVKSLFSRHAKLKRDGKLTPPTKKTISIDYEIQRDSHDCDAIMKQELTADIVFNIINDCKADSDDRVLEKYVNLVFVGIIKDLSENECKVKCIHECSQNQFKWPIKSEECWYGSMLCVLNIPIPVNNRYVFKLPPDDFENFKKFQSQFTIKGDKLRKEILVYIQQ